MKNLLLNKKTGLVLGIITILLKICIIDIDPPKWAISHYQPIDELYYAFVALNLYEYNSLFHNEIPQIFGTPILTDIVAYFTLKLFGDNYLGLRLGSIIFSLISFFYFWKLLTKIVSDKYIVIGFSVFFVINYWFTLSNIILEPSIARMAVMLFTIYLVTKLYDIRGGRLKYYLLGLVPAFLVSITYPTNAFIILGIFLFVVVKSFSASSLKDTFQKIKGRILLYFLGVSTAGLIYLSFSFFMGENILTAALTKGEVFAPRVALLSYSNLYNILNIAKANIFRFNPLLFLLFVTSLICLDYKNFNKWSNGLILVSLILVSLFLQTVFINDYPERKLIILLPLVTIIIAKVMNDFLALKKLWFSTFLKRKQIIPIFIFLWAFLIGFHWSVNSKGVSFEYLLSTSLMLVFLFVGLITRKSKIIVLIGLLFLGIPELLHSSKHFLRDRSYHYKNAMIALQEFDNEKFIGGFSMGFRLYNNIHSSINIYLHYYENNEEYWNLLDNTAKSNNIIDYSIGYAKDESKFKSIGFEPLYTLMKAKNTVYKNDIVVYQAKR